MNLKKTIKHFYLHIGKYLYGNNFSKVVYYHDLHSTRQYTPMSTSAEMFKTHLDIVAKKGYAPVSEIDSTEKQIEITFDDGFRGLYENFSLIMEKDIPVRLFLITERLGDKGYLAKDEIKEMLATGLLSIGSHTHTHSDLEKLAEKEIFDELERSKKILEDTFSVSIQTLCYPRGRFNDTVIETANNLGYTKQYTCLPGPYGEPFRNGLVNRSLVQDASPADFRLILDGGDRIFFARYLQQHYHPEHST